MPTHYNDADFAWLDNTIRKYLRWYINGWNTFHKYLFSFPNEPTEDDIFTAKIFCYLIFPSLIDCPQCEYHYKKYLEKHPPPLDNKKTIFYWSVDIHNEVNKRLKKPIVDKEIAFRYYEIGLTNLPKNKDEMEKIVQLIDDDAFYKEYVDYLKRRENGESTDIQNIASSKQFLILFLIIVLILFVIYVNNRIKK